jgi:hypothetical protein
MDKHDEAQQRLYGQMSCLVLAVQVLIHTHPNKRAVADALKKFEEDVPDIVALNHPGRPAIDGEFRTLLKILIQAAEHVPQTAHVRFPPFGTGGPQG